VLCPKVQPYNTLFELWFHHQPDELAANLPQLFSYLSQLDEFLILLITTGFGFLFKIFQKQRNSHSGYFQRHQRTSGFI
jgi:hypothetical protein